MTIDLGFIGLVHYLKDSQILGAMASYSRTRQVSTSNFAANVHTYYQTRPTKVRRDEEVQLIAVVFEHIYGCVYGKPSVTIFPVHYDYIKLPKNCHIMALCHNIMTIISQYYDLVLVTILGPIILCHTGIYHHIMTHNIMP